MKKRSQYSPAFKLKAVLKLLKEEITAAEVASELEIHPTMLHAWRREFLEKASGIFTGLMGASVRSWPGKSANALVT